MASLRLLTKKSANLAPTVATLANGTPYAPRLDLNVRAPHDGHGDHSHGAGGPRSDAPPNWVGGASGYSSKLFLNAAPSVQGARTIHTSASNSDAASSVPDFAPYRVKSEPTNRALTYFVIGSTGLLSASFAQSTVTGFLQSMSASADVLALAKIEVEMANIPEGKNVILKWRGKPVFIRHRTEEEIEEARAVDIKTLRDPEKDEDRTQKPEWLVMLGVCTHLGCVPIGESGDYGGWFCPCHGSHYDISGRVRKGPAPLNLEVPAYSFNEEAGKIIVG